MSYWKPDYSVQVQQLDNQHKEFFGILEELSVAVDEEDHLDIDYIVVKLDLYALYHFACEDHYLAKYGYPDFEVHKQLHAGYSKGVETVKEKLAEDKISGVFELFDFMKEWWEKHILKSDKQYGPFLSERLKNIPF